MPKNYYVILGIPSSATVDDIKTAYRRLAKEFHPDYYGGSSKSPFLAIQEAYSVLSDPQRRRQYDRRLDDVRMNVTSKRAGRPQFAPHHEEAEPLIPEERLSEPLGNSTGGARRASWTHPTSLFDGFFDRASQNWNYRRPRRDRSAVVITLTAKQAQRGGHARVNLPARIRCPDCNGSGGTAYECWRCFGDGVLRGEIPLLLSYPAGIPDGHRVELPLRQYGLPDVIMTVAFTVLPG